MAKKPQPSPTHDQATTDTPEATAFGMPLPSHLKESAQQIWLAGLGAFSKVQAEGGKVFDTLVNDGLNLQRKTQALAEERMAEATSRFSQLGSELSSKAMGSVDRLENIFEDRVAKALHKMGMPSARDLEALQARIAELEQAMARLSPTPTRRRAAASHQAAPAKTAAGRTAPRKTPRPKP